jgi:hypothetical protein
MKFRRDIKCEIGPRVEMIRAAWAARSHVAAALASMALAPHVYL